MCILVLEPIHREEQENESFLEDPNCQEVLNLQIDFYNRVGFKKPWIGYFALEEGKPVGSVSFKGKPQEGKVEIAYFTFPENEGRGVGTQMCQLIIRQALKAQPALTLFAQTLPEESASTSILKKNGFQMVGEVEDPEDGEVWEWQYQIG